jgi:hypothetical protein
MRPLVLFFMTVATAHANPLLGTWGPSWPCDGATGQEQYFPSGLMVRHWTRFADDACTQPLFVTVDYARYQIGPASTAVPGATDFDVSFESHGILVLDESFAQKLNSEKTCGIDNWKVMQFQSIPADQRCLNLGQSGFRVYSIFKIENDRFHWGAPSNEHYGATPETRHRLWYPLSFQKTR